MTHRREIGVAVSLCLAGAAVLLLAAGRDWVRLPADALSATAAYAKGGSADLLQALALAALAGVVGIAAARGRGRIAVGIVLALLGFAAFGISVRAGVDPSAPARSGGVQVARAAATSTGWPWVAAVAGLLLAAAGTIVAARGREWSAMSQRYAGAAASSTPDITDAGLWDALSRGDDPT
ncbi:MAG: Trp biosynthesis-associated membrane protein [Actinomycetota bacterium]